METILTVLSTLGVGALAYAFAGVIRLSKRVDDLELIRMEIVDLESNLIKGIEEEIRERELLGKDVHDKIEGWISSTDRRTDKLWTEVHKLDTQVNPKVR